MRTFNSNVAQISDLHSRSLNNMDDAAAQRNAAQLDELVEDTSALSATLKKQIKVLEAGKGSGRDGQIRQQQVRFAIYKAIFIFSQETQTALVKSKFVEAIQNYQSVEQQYRAKYKQRMERQYKIGKSTRGENYGLTLLIGFTVKPDATPEEVKAVVNDEQGGQIFSQAVCTDIFISPGCLTNYCIIQLMNNRYTDSRAAYREVQERHEDIKRIEKTLAELAQLFNDVRSISFLF